MTQLLSNDQARIEVHKHLRTIETTWIDYAGGRDFRSIVDATVEYYKRYKAKYVLHDTRLFRPISNAELDYAVRLSRNSYCPHKQIFAVMPQYPLSQYSLLQFVRKLDGLVPFRVFATRQDAILTIQRELIHKNQLSLFDNP